MNDQHPDVILEPGDDPKNIIVLTFETEIHAFPSEGPLHRSLRCWCDPRVEIDAETGLPLFIHLHEH